MGRGVAGVREVGEAMKPYHTEPDATFWVGDVRDCLAAIEEASVQTCVCSPPYFGLRRYAGVEPTVWGGSKECEHVWNTRDEYHNRGDSSAGAKQKTNVGAVTGRGIVQDATCLRCNAWYGLLGLEPTPGLFIDHLVEVFRGVKRVLRDDGCLFVNISDSFAGSGKGPTGHNGIGDQEERQGFSGGDVEKSVPAKNLLLVPERFVIAMQEDGWIVRSKIIWAKKSCMPESVEDRPTNAHEVIYMFAKQARYFWDKEAVREPSVDPAGVSRGGTLSKFGRDEQLMSGYAHRGDKPYASSGGRNLRNVWFPDPDDQGSDFWHLGPEPLKLSHYAAFPRSIPRRAVLASTSEAGCCASCGAPYVRITQPTAEYAKHLGRDWANYDEDAKEGRGHSVSVQRPTKRNAPSLSASYQTLGFRPQCSCNAPARPCIVLDCFLGSGTTAVVARELGRHVVGIDASQVYMDMAIERFQATVPSLLTPDVVAPPISPAEQLALFPHASNDSTPLDNCAEKDLSDV